MRFALVRMEFVAIATPRWDEGSTPDQLNHVESSGENTSCHAVEKITDESGQPNGTATETSKTIATTAIEHTGESVGTVASPSTSAG